MVFPKRVWAYWEGDINKLPPFEKMCYDSWKAWLPGYEITIVNGLEHLKKLVPASYLPGSLDKIEVVQKRANSARLALLRTYGGVWHDMSILLCDNYKWLENEMNKGKDFAGYAMYKYSDDGKTDQVVENWWIASQKEGIVVTEWGKLWNEEITATKGSDDFSKRPIYSQDPPPFRESNEKRAFDHNYLYQAFLLRHLRKYNDAVKNVFESGKAYIMKAEDGPFWALYNIEDRDMPSEGQKIPRITKLPGRCDKLKKKLSSALSSGKSTSDMAVAIATASTGPKAATTNWNHWIAIIVAIIMVVMLIAFAYLKFTNN